MSAESITVRPCREEDLDAVQLIWVRSRSRHASSDDRHEDLERLLEEFPGALLVAESDGTPVGTVIAGWDGWRGNVYRLAVLREHRRRGIGRTLVEAAEAHFRERGGRRVTALVAHEDESAGRFWDSLGYPRDAQIGRRVKNI